MPYNPDQHHRRSIRLRGYDYTQAGAYFIAIVTQQRLCLFGDIVDGAMQANAYGNVVATTWKWLPQQYPYVHLDAWVLMPNHMHGIIILHNHSVHPGSGSRTAPTNEYDDDSPIYLATGGPTAPTNEYDDDSPILPTTRRKSLGRLIGAFKYVYYAAPYVRLLLFIGLLSGTASVHLPHRSQLLHLPLP